MADGNKKPMRLYYGPPSSWVAAESRSYLEWFDWVVGTLTFVSLDVSGFDDEEDMERAWCECDMIPGKFFAAILGNVCRTYVVVSTTRPKGPHRSFVVGPDEMTKNGLPVFLVRYVDKVGYYEAFVGKQRLYKVDDSKGSISSISYDELRDTVTEIAETRREYMLRVGKDARWPMLNAERKLKTCYVRKESKASHWEERKRVVMLRWLLNRQRAEGRRRAAWRC